MPTRDQVAFHNQQQLQMEQARAAQGYQAQAGLAAQQHAYGLQSMLAQHQLGQVAAANHVDLQARLHQVTLNQDEQDRVRRLEHARASVEDNPNLSPNEKAMLYTQIQSGLNPLENRQREAGILNQHLQSQALAQQTQQQADLFNQRQQRLAAGLQGRMQVIQDPLTGRQQLFQMDLEGNMQPLDFSTSQTMHEAQLQHMQAQTEATQQGTAQREQMFPGQLQRQGIDTQTAAAQLQYMRQLHPLQVEHARAANTLLAQQIEQNPASFQLQQLQGYAHLGNLQQQLSERLQTQPYNVGLAQANSAIAQMNMMNHPNDTRLRQAAQVANIAHTQAQTLHTNAVVDQMPSVLAARQAGTEHTQITTQIASEQLQRMTRGGLSERDAATVVEHAIGGVDREIAAADRAAANVALTPSQRETARLHAEQLRANRTHAIQQRAEEAEDLIRRANGMPPVNRPPHPAGRQEQQQQFDQVLNRLLQPPANPQPAPQGQGPEPQPFWRRFVEGG